MKLNKRERILTIGVASLLVVFVAWMAMGSVQSPFSDLEGQKTAVAEELTKKSAELTELQKADARLKEFKSRSLPSDPTVAATQYKNWLMDLVEQQVKFRGLAIERTQPISQQDIYRGTSFTLSAKGSWDQLTAFLHKFYSAGHLHLIRRLTIKPIEKSSDLELTIVVEAIALQGVDRKTDLPSVPGVLAKADLSAYKAIAERRLFASPSPPAPPPRDDRPPERRPDPPKFDPSKYARFTAIVEVDGRPEAWLRSLTTDEQFKLHAGDPVALGPFKGQIARIDSREVEVVVDGERYLIPLGEDLRSSTSKPPPDSAEAKSEKPEEKPGEKPAAEAEAEKKPPMGGPPGSREADNRDRRPEDFRRKSFGGRDRR